MQQLNSFIEFINVQSKYSRGSHPWVQYWVPRQASGFASSNSNPSKQRTESISRWCWVDDAAMSSDLENDECWWELWRRWRLKITTTTMMMLMVIKINEEDYDDDCDNCNNDDVTMTKMMIIIRIVYWNISAEFYWNQYRSWRETKTTMLSSLSLLFVVIKRW